MYEKGLANERLTRSGLTTGMPDGLSSWRSYWNFRHEVPRGWRYVRFPDPINSLRPLQSAVTPARSTYPKDATSTGLGSPIAMSRFRHRRYRSGRGVAGAHEAHFVTAPPKDR